MAKAAGKPGESGARKRRGAAQTRREAVERQVKQMLRDPRVGWGLVTATVFVVLATLAGVWAQDRPLVGEGRVMSGTRAVRMEFSVEDADLTEAARQTARTSTPRIFVAEPSRLEELSASIGNLPLTLAGVESLDEVDAQIRQNFGLTQESLAAVLSHVSEGVADPAWATASGVLAELVRESPMVSRETWQRFTQEGVGNQIELRIGNAPGRLVPATRVVNIGASEETRREDAELLAARAGFDGIERRVVAARIMSVTRPTFEEDQAATRAAQEAAAAQVPAATRVVPAGEILYRRGDVLGPTAAQLLRAELESFNRSAPAWRITARRLSLGAVVAGVTAGMAGYVIVFCPRVRRNPTRAAALAALGLLVIWLAAIVAVYDPRLVLLALVVPTVLAGSVIVVAYDRRTALALGAGIALLVSLLLSQAVAALILTLGGVAVAAWQLQEIRERRTLIRAGVMLALCLGGGTLATSLVILPVSAESMTQALLDAAFLALGGLTVAGMILFILPVLEKAFDITTGLTLIELRDPKHPLLRQLQQQAPGTYNHSLNVASISEAAADAVGADSLLTYVGCLYHDIGKMTKPEYFVENQAGGPNKHDRLSPAMSLLVIVGHVKDGLEMAREYDLPRAIEHFIEAHHGTTLVEYFYRRAVEQAKDGSESVPEELSYRYPGPKPRTREVAIAMLSDAVESATRTLSDPTPSRIDALVRSIANKRLMDGQFDDCDLTLRQLQAIVESVSKTVSAIYHGRIAYPGAGAPKKKTTVPGVPAETGGAAGTSAGAASGSAKSA
ncbi:MAG: HDIG domain-containing protein [Phycisphaeraceae bacterium]|nr:HDIG domain-containing protein [Phycisphaeraceae bacterium]